MSLPFCIFPGDQAVILVGMGALEAGRGGAVFLFSWGFWGGVGSEPLLLLIYPVCSSLRGDLFICNILEALEK